MSNRSRTRERRQQREQERKRNRQLMLVGGLVVAAVLIGVFLLIANQPAEAPISEEVIAAYSDIPHSVNEAGFPVLGETDAPVQVVEYASFDCPHCANFHQEASSTLATYARNGDIALTYVPLYGTGGIPNGQGAARAALCAGQQDAFWPYAGTLYSWVSVYGNQAYAGNRLQTGAENMGLDVEAWNACLTENTDDILLEANRNANSLEGFSGTPTVLVNGEIVTATLADVTAAIDAALAAAPERPETDDVEATPEVTTEPEAEATEPAEATEEAEVTEEPEATEAADAADDATEEPTADATEDDVTPEATEEAED